MPKEKSVEQKFDEEADRLVRPSPKNKPPRYDRRREVVKVEEDPDLDARDPDLSLNYKGAMNGYSDPPRLKPLKKRPKPPKRKPLPKRPKPPKLPPRPKPRPSKILPSAKDYDQAFWDNMVPLLKERMSPDFFEYLQDRLKEDRESYDLLAIRRPEVPDSIETYGHLREWVQQAGGLDHLRRQKKASLSILKELVRSLGPTLAQRFQSLDPEDARTLLSAFRSYRFDPSTLERPWWVTFDTPPPWDDLVRSDRGLLLPVNLLPQDEKEQFEHDYPFKVLGASLAWVKAWANHLKSNGFSSKCVALLLKPCDPNTLRSLGYQEGGKVPKFYPKVAKPYLEGKALRWMLFDFNQRANEFDPPSKIAQAMNGTERFSWLGEDLWPRFCAKIVQDLKQLAPDKVPAVLKKLNLFFSVEMKDDPWVTDLDQYDPPIRRTAMYHGLIKRYLEEKSQEKKTKLARRYVSQHPTGFHRYSAVKDYMGNDLNSYVKRVDRNWSAVQEVYFGFVRFLSRHFLDESGSKFVSFPITDKLRAAIESAVQIGSYDSLSEVMAYVPKGTDEYDEWVKFNKIFDSTTEYISSFVGTIRQNEVGRVERYMGDAETMLQGQVPKTKIQKLNRFITYCKKVIPVLGNDLHQIKTLLDTVSSTANLSKDSVPKTTVTILEHLYGILEDVDTARSKAGLPYRYELTFQRIMVCTTSFLHTEKFLG